MYENKKIFILGMARSGYEAAKFLAKFNNKIVINDGSKDQNMEHVSELKNLGVEVILGEHPDNILTKDFDYIIKNPGIKDTHKYIQFAYENNIKVINEMELAYYFLSKKNATIIGITGTNGKTTTTTLIYEIIKCSNRNVHLTGNIGYPVTSFIDSINENDYVVTEISIQQLVNLDTFKPKIAVLTNISEAHIDHVGSFENYKLIKKKIFKNHDSNNYAIINNDNLECVNITSDINSTKLYFSRSNMTDIYLDNGYIYYKNEKYISTDEIKLVGEHNYENIMCAILACKLINIEDEYIKKILNEFTGVEHRLEYVTTIDGVKFYNDSKATNNKSTMIALSAFKNPTLLLMGGLDRGIPFDELLPYMKNVKCVYAYGETRFKIGKFCKNNNIECEILENLIEATNLAYQNSCKGDIILLSPACASWDQYKKFEDRGLEFKNTIKILEGK